MTTLAIKYLLIVAVAGIALCIVALLAFIYNVKKVDDEMGRDEE